MENLNKKKEESQTRYKTESKKRLLKILETKLKTSFIGSLSAFEETFGFLWGAEKVSLTEEQEKLIEILDRHGFDERYFDNLWQMARMQVLNNGNNQIRAVRQEMEQHTINWERYRVTFPVLNETDPDGHYKELKEKFNA